MSTTTREFTRNFPIHRREALTGKPVKVRDREGNAFTFTLDRPAPHTLAEAVGHLIGIGDTGKARKSLRGYSH